MKKQIYSIDVRFSDRDFVEINADKAQYEKFKEVLLSDAQWKDDVFFVFSSGDGDETIVRLDDVRTVEVSVFDDYEEED